MIVAPSLLFPVPLVFGLEIDDDSYFVDLRRAVGLKQGKQSVFRTVGAHASPSGALSRQTDAMSCRLSVRCSLRRLSFKVSLRSEPAFEFRQAV